MTLALTIMKRLSSLPKGTGYFRLEGPFARATIAGKGPVAQVTFIGKRTVAETISVAKGPVARATSVTPR